MSKKYESPFPGRQITGNDFNELVVYVNSVIEKSSINEESQSAIEQRLIEFDKHVDIQINKFNKEIVTSKVEMVETLNKVQQLNKRLDDFYGKIIEIVGIFIAVFSFIIAGIQISFKIEGATFIDKLINSCAIFIPIMFCIIILLLMIKWIIKR
jgi:hypothetical protein